MGCLDDLLVKTSRTFALSVPLLPEPTRREVTTAYLLFRIADTFEDAASWPREKRLKALAEFSSLLEEPSRGEAEASSSRWVAEKPIRHDGYLELLSEAPFVLQTFWQLDDPSRSILREHLQRTTRGMSSFVSRTRDSGELTLRDLEDLRAYCYVVAGIVGEMLTELFLLGRESLVSVADYLRCRASRFGEGLQLVNIVKDTSRDLSEGRRYLPSGVSRAQVFDLARQSLTCGAEYVIALQGAGALRGVVAFNAMPLRLAWATLDRVEEQGAGSKLTRPEVFALMEQMNGALDRGEPAVPFAPGGISEIT